MNMNTNTIEVQRGFSKEVPMGLSEEEKTYRTQPYKPNRNGQKAILPPIEKHYPCANDNDPNQRISVYSAKLSPRRKRFIDSQLRIGNATYHTLISGVTKLTLRIDFKGLMKVRHTNQGETHIVVFAMFYCPNSSRYVLTSLGQYSMRSYQRELADHRTGERRNKRFSIQLSPILRTHLPELKRNLLHTNLSRASVCLLK